jgi:hypothetical protein
MSELVRSPQLLNCGKHVSEPLRAIAVAAKIKADDDSHRSSPTVSKRDSRQGRRSSNRPRLAMRTVKSSAMAVLSILLPAPLDSNAYTRPIVGSAAWAPLLDAGEHIEIRLLSGQL